MIDYGTILMLVNVLVFSILVVIYMKKKKKKKSPDVAYKSGFNLIVSLISLPIRLFLLSIVVIILFTYPNNLLFTLLMIIPLTLAALPYNTNGYYKMYRVIFPISIITTIYIFLTIGPIAELIFSFRADMNEGIMFALQENYMQIIIIVVMVIFAYYIWSRILVGMIFKEMRRETSSHGPTNKLGRCYFLAGKYGKYDKLRCWIINKIAPYAAKIGNRSSIRPIRIRRAMPNVFSIAYVNQAGFPFFHPRRRMTKILPIDIVNYDIPGIMVIKYSGHLEYIGHNTLCAIGGEMVGANPDVESYRIDIHDDLEIQARRTQKAVTLDAELNKSLTLKSSAYLPDNIKKWAEKLKMR